MKNTENVETKLMSKMEVIEGNHSNLVSTVQKLSKEQKQSEAQLRKAQSTADEIQIKLSERGVKIGDEEEFPTKKTLVATGVRCYENEDLEDLAKTLIHRELKLSHVAIIRTKRMNTWQNGKGLIKIELGE